MPKIPLIEDLTHGPISPGTSILVEFDPSSLWYNATFTIAAGWLKSDGRVSYFLLTRPPDEVRAKLRQRGLDVSAFESKEKLRIYDGYTLTQGKKSKEKYSLPSLKTSDLSILVGKDVMPLPPAPDSLWMGENYSVLGRFNDERSWVDLVLNRFVPTLRQRQITTIGTVMIGVHSEWTYKQFESAFDGIVDFKVEELGGELRTMMRIKAMHDVAFDSKWHPLKVEENFEVTLEK